MTTAVTEAPATASAPEAMADAPGAAALPPDSAAVAPSRKRPRPDSRVEEAHAEQAHQQSRFVRRGRGVAAVSDARAAPPASGVSEAIFSARDTVFVSNIGPDTDEAKLRSVFSAAGDIVAVHVGRSRDGRPRGFAHVQFASDTAVSRAMSLDRPAVDSRTWLVMPFRERREDATGAHDAAAGASAGPDPRTLYVSNLAYRATSDDLRKLFGEHGRVVDVRLPLGRGGQHKAFAYVEFADELSARNALVLHRFVFMGRPLSVALSNPTRKGRDDGGADAQPERESAAETAANPSASQASPAAGRRRAGPALTQTRTAVSLVPRTVRRSGLGAHDDATAAAMPTAAPADPALSTSAPAAKPLSNDDFRRRFVQSRGSE